jgi:cyanophycin synthetase
MLKIEKHKIFFGPNPYANSAVIILDIEISQQSIDLIINRCKNLRIQFPEWFENSELKDIEDILYIANTVVAFSLNILNEVRGFIQTCGVKLTNTGFKLWIGFHDIATSIKAIELTLMILENLNKSIDIRKNIIEHYLEGFWKLCRIKHPDYQARILMVVAKYLDIPVLPLFNGDKIWQFGWGERNRIFFESSSNQDGYLGNYISNSKSVSKLFMSNLGIPTAKYELVNSIEGLTKAVETIGFPCVSKPLDAGGGRGVTANITSISDLEVGFNEAKRFTKQDIMIEKFVMGDDYRIMIIEGKLDKVFKRIPPTIKGDGISSVNILIDKLNKNRSSNIVKSNYLRPILIDNVLLSHIQKQNITLETILPKEISITLRSNANLSTGGETIDFTEFIHSDIKLMAETIALASGINVIGVDYITTDISKSYKQTQGAFIEFNTTPGLEIYHAAGLDPMASITKVLGTKPSRIPFDIALVKKDDLLLIENWILEHLTNDHLGWICKEKIYLGKTPLISIKNEDWLNVNVILKQPSVKSILCICTSEDIENRGMPVDKCNLIYTTKIEINKTWTNVLKENSKEIVSFDKYTDLLLNFFKSQNIK